jgi:hypothetical protein
LVAIRAVLFKSFSIYFFGQSEGLRAEKLFLGTALYLHLKACRRSYIARRLRLQDFYADRLSVL